MHHLKSGMPALGVKQGLSAINKLGVAGSYLIKSISLSHVGKIAAELSKPLKYAATSVPVPLLAVLALSNYDRITGKLSSCLPKKSIEDYIPKAISKNIPDQIKNPVSGVYNWGGELSSTMHNGLKILAPAIRGQTHELYQDLKHDSSQVIKGVLEGAICNPKVVLAGLVTASPFFLQAAFPQSAAVAGAAYGVKLAVSIIGAFGLHLTLLNYDTIVNAVPEALKSLNTPKKYTPDFVQTMLLTFHKNALVQAPKLREKVLQVVDLFATNLDAPIEKVKFGLENYPSVAVPSLISSLPFVGKALFPNSASAGIGVDLIKMLAPAIPLAGMTYCLYQISATLAELGPGELKAMAQKIAKIKLEAQGFKKIDPEPKMSEEEQDKILSAQLHYPETVTDKINEFKSIIASSYQAGKSQVKSFCFHGPPGTGKSRLMEKMAVELNKSVSARGGKVYHFKLGQRNLSVEPDWRLNEIIKHVKGEASDMFEEATIYEQVKNLAKTLANQVFKSDQDAIFIEIDEADQINTEKLQTFISDLEKTGQNVTITMTTNKLNALPDPIQRRVEPLYVGLPNEDQKEAILKGVVKQTFINKTKIFYNTDKETYDDTGEILTKLQKTGGWENAIQKEGITGDHIEKAYRRALAIVLAQLSEQENTEQQGSSSTSGLRGFSLFLNFKNDTHSDPDEIPNMDQVSDEGIESILNNLLRSPALGSSMKTGDLEKIKQYIKNNINEIATHFNKNIQEKIDTMKPVEEILGYESSLE